MSFRDLERADQLIADAAKYKVWKAKDTEAKQALYEGLGVERFVYEKANIYIAPFGIAGRDTFVAAEGPKDGQAPPCPTLETLLSGYYEGAAPAAAGDSIIPSSIFSVSKLARLTVKRRKTDATTKRPSRITGRRYYRHVTDSASMPFGKKVAADSYGSAVAAIRSLAAFDTFADVKGNSITFTPEG